MQKPSDTRWLARVRAVYAVRRSLLALVSTFEELYEETGDAEAHHVVIDRGENLAGAGLNCFWPGPWPGLMLNKIQVALVTL